MVLEFSVQCTLCKRPEIQMTAYKFACFWLITLGDVQFSQHHTVSQLVVSQHQRVSGILSNILRVSY